MRYGKMMLALLCALAVAGAGLLLPGGFARLQTRALYRSSEQRPNAAPRLQFTHEEELAMLLALPRSSKTDYELPMTDGEMPDALARMQAVAQALAGYGIPTVQWDAIKKQNLYLTWYSDGAGHTALAQHGYFADAQGNVLHLALHGDTGTLLQLTAEGPAYAAADRDALAQSMAAFCTQAYGFARVGVMPYDQGEAKAYVDGSDQLVTQWASEMQHYLLVCTHAGAPQASVSLPLYVGADGLGFNH